MLDINSTITRLSGAKLGEEMQFGDSGYEAGKEWAANMAGYHELLHVVNSRDEYEVYNTLVEFSHFAGYLKHLDYLYEIFYNWCDHGPHDYHWLELNKAVIRGFQEGAKEVWDLVSEHL